MIENAIKSLADWVITTLSDFFISTLNFFFPSFSINWSPLANIFAFANDFAPVSEFFLFLFTYMTLKATVWVLKLAIALL